MKHLASYCGTSTKTCSLLRGNFRKNDERINRQGVNSVKMQHLGATMMKALLFHKEQGRSKQKYQQQVIEQKQRRM
jgi:hypothetical protein